MLHGSPAILVVDDEAFIALDVAMAVEDAGGTVVGPAASVAEALELLESTRLSGAILDFNLPDGDIGPVVERLTLKGIPFIIQTGVGVPTSLATRFPDLVVVIKPVIAATIVDRLVCLMASSEEFLATPDCSAPRLEA